MNRDGLRVIANEMFPVLGSELGENFVDARTLHENLMVGKDFTNWIKDRIDQYGFENGLDFSPYLAKTSTGGRPRTEYLLTLDCAKEIAMVQNNEIGRSVRKYFIEVEKRSKKRPQSIEDLIIMQAESMKDVKTRLVSIESKAEKINHRINNLDGTNIQGNEQQQFNQMLKRFAWQEGVQISKAWKLFDQAFNTAFHTNLTAKRENYAARNGFKSLTRPQYLSVTGQVQDGIRVLDKMLNEEVG
jgi:phage anti-repressor protein